MAESNTEREGLLTIGTLLANGKYRVEQYLSSGGFGNTYVATDLAFDEKVAIKELYIKGVCGREPHTNEVAITLTENQRTFEAQREKFRKEARRLRRLSNAHIVKVHDLFDENGTSYYVMDFIEGESLSARAKRTGHPIAPADLLLLLPQILDALETVHSAGIWHLDLKPANIMIDSRGNVQLIDFGASKQLRNSDGQSLSTSSALAYTPGYAPSEQMEQNIDKFGPWTDLYALGATLFNLLTRQQPPSPSDIDEDVNEALIHYLPSGVSPKFRDLIVWLMKPNRKMRPQSVSDVRQYLAEAKGTDKPKAKDTHKKPKTPPVTDDDDDTTLKTKLRKQREEEERKKREEEEKKKIQLSDTEADELIRSTAWMSWALPIIAGVVIIIGVFTCRHSKSHEADTEPAATTDTTTTTDSIYVWSKKVHTDDGPENMQDYTYTGVAMVVFNDKGDTLQVIPNGEGTARFSIGEYNGQFFRGMLYDSTGKATLTFDNGDKYVGTFQEGYYVEGTYTTHESGMYFKGTFRDGNTYNGYWYDSNGNKQSQVVNGSEKGL